MPPALAQSDHSLMQPSADKAGNAHSRGRLLYWEEPSAFIAGEPAVQDGSVYSFTVLDRLLQQAFQTFPNLATVTVTVSTGVAALVVCDTSAELSRVCWPGACV